MFTSFKQKIVISIFTAICISYPDTAISQDSITVNYQERPGILHPAPVIAAVTVAYAAGLYYMNNNYYPDDDRVSFYFYNDNKGYLQVDKFQHTFTSYTISHFGYQYLLYSGVKKNKALLWGGSLGFLMQTPKEIFDGHYIGAGFSWGDVAGNLAGSAFFIGQQLLFDEQLLKYKFSFTRSSYAKQSGGFLGDSFYRSYSLDYNGHTYWLSLNANKLFLKNKLPDWVNIAVGYSANGMFGPYENIESYNGVIIPETQRYRQYLLSLDIDWPKIKTRSKFLKFVLNGIVWVKLPFPAIELNSKGQLKGYWLYF